MKITGTRIYLNEDQLNYLNNLLEKAKEQDGFLKLLNAKIQAKVLKSLVDIEESK
jgi:hypothetical protein